MSSQNESDILVALQQIAHQLSAINAKLTSLQSIPSHLNAIAAKMPR